MAIASALLGGVASGYGQLETRFTIVGIASVDQHSKGRADHRATGTFRILEIFS
jgi:hypothetical protein